MHRLIVVLVVALGTFRNASTELLPVDHVRALAIQSDSIILGSLTNPETPQRIRVERVLFGEGVRRGEMLSVPLIGEYIRPDDTVNAHRVQQVLLFLQPLNTENNTRAIVMSGVRCLTKNGQVWRPVQPDNPGPYRLVLEQDLDWLALLARVQSDANELRTLYDLKAIPRAERRNRALLDWLDRHRYQFSENGHGGWSDGKSDDLHAQGWNSLEHLPFHWVLETGIVEDCWRAVRLYAEVHDGACLGRTEPAFASPRGRAYLLEIARDENRLRGDRVRALRLLATDSTLSPKHSQKTPWIQPMAEEEQLELLIGLEPLLRSSSSTLKQQSATTIRNLSRVEGSSTEYRQDALDALGKAYRTERPGTAREAISKAIRAIAGAERWKEITAHKIDWAIYLHELHQEEQSLVFWLALEPNGPVVPTQPVVVLQRLNVIGWVKETRKFPLPTTSPLDWKTAWKTTSPLHVRLPIQGYEPGVWRIKVQGVLGEEKIPWESEPRSLRFIDRTSSSSRSSPKEGKVTEIRFPGEDR